MKVTREMVEAVKADGCFVCGVHSYEDCPKPGYQPCGREHLGGTRAAVEENETSNDYVSDNGQFGAGA